MQGEKASQITVSWFQTMPGYIPYGHYITTAIKVKFKYMVKKEK